MPKKKIFEEPENKVEIKEIELPQEEAPKDNVELVVEEQAEQTEKPKKVKKKRVLSEERKQQLREQLAKGKTKRSRKR